jgi:hypothetical protein
MSDLPASPTPVRTALFVDFDNIYLGLQNEDPQAAEQFATHPGRWLRWLAENLPFDSYGDEAQKARRRILFRRCYLNPSQFSRFRPYFIRSAFEVVDCPPLTRGGKTSADIQMVMDIMDALGHATRFEEFILLSGDADFTPLLLRLSKHDRRSVVLAAGPASAAYKAACDLVIDQDVFLEEAIGVVSEGGMAARSVENQELLTRIAEKIHERASLTGELVATDLPAIFREFPEFTPDSNWLGFYSLRGMASAVIRTRRDLAMVEGDPWRVRLRGEGEILPEPPPPAAVVAPLVHRPVAPSPPPSFAPTPQVDPVLLSRIAERIHDRMMFSGVLLATELPAIFREFPEFTPNSNWLGFYSLRAMTAGVLRTRPDLQILEGDPWRIERRPEPPEGEPKEAPAVDPETLTGQIVEYVRSVVESSDTAVPMARAAQTVISRFGSDVLSSGWAGAGSFRDLLEAQENPGFAISSVKPGYLYNPKRHSVPSAEEGEVPIGSPELSSLAHRIHRLTDAPFMTPAEYALVFSKIAEEVNEHQYFLTRTSKNVRDRCIEVGEPIARASVNFVLRGITFAGHRFEEGAQQNPRVLGEAFVKNLIGLCESAGLSLGEEEKALLGEWILSDLPPSEGAEASEPPAAAEEEADLDEAAAEVETRQA